MANKRFWLVILAIVLVFGMTVVGCDNGGDDSGSDTWSAVTSMTQLNGTWKGSASQSQSQQGLTVTMTMEMTVTIVATNATTGTMSGTQKQTQILSGSGAYFDTAWTQMKAGAGGPEEEGVTGEEGVTVTINESNHSISATFPMEQQSISLSDEEFTGILINQNGKKLKQPEGNMGEGSPEIIFIKQ